MVLEDLDRIPSVGQVCVLAEFCVLFCIAFSSLSCLVKKLACPLSSSTKESYISSLVPSSVGNNLGFSLYVAPNITEVACHTLVFTPHHVFYADLFRIGDEAVVYRAVTHQVVRSRVSGGFLTASLLPGHELSDTRYVNLGLGILNSVAQ